MFSTFFFMIILSFSPYNILNKQDTKDCKVFKSDKSTFNLYYNLMAFMSFSFKIEGN